MGERSDAGLNGGLAESKADRLLPASAVRVTERLRAFGMACLAAGVLIAIWEFASRFVNPVLLPAPLDVLQESMKMAGSGQIWSDLWETLKRVFVGFGAGSAIGMFLGLIIGRVRLLREFFDPLVQFFRALPPIAIIPLIIIWFGLGETSKYIVVGYGAFFVVLVNTVDGVLRISTVREQAARSLGANGLQVFYSVVIPSTAPYIITGMRVAIGISFMSVVAAEMIAAESGIGFLIMQSRLTIQTPRIFVGLVLLGALGFLADRIFGPVIRRIAGRYLRHLELGRE